MTAKFVVAPDAKFTQDYHVMVHFADQDDQLMYSDDHDPPMPTSGWKPGQTVEYTRTFFTPVYPYVGEATVEIGMYAPGEKLRVPMAGTDTGHRSYKIAKFQLLAQTEGVQAIYQDGWHPAEGATANGVGWHWTKKEAAFAVKNPKKDCIFYLDVDNPSTLFNTPQQITVSTGSGAMVDQLHFVTPKQPVLRKIPISASAWGAAENRRAEDLGGQDVCTRLAVAHRQGSARTWHPRAARVDRPGPVSSAGGVLCYTSCLPCEHTDLRR